MAKAEHPALLAARESFVTELAGELFDLREGDLIEADHPIVKKYPRLFEAPILRFPVKNRVEQATAAPGEKRGA